jgi:hypothetical protein
MKEFVYKNLLYRSSRDSSKNDEEGDGRKEENNKDRGGKKERD